MTGRSVFPTTLMIFGILVSAPARTDDIAAADGTQSWTCALRVFEAEVELDDLREEERVAPLTLKADQAVYELLEPLWKARLTEKLRYLAAKHARDTSRLRVERAAIEVERAVTKAKVLADDCFSRSSEKDEGTRRYVALTCDVVGQDKKIASLDLEYRRKVLASTEELRSRDIATAQELIAAQHEVANADARLRERTRRHRACKG